MMRYLARLSARCNDPRETGARRGRLASRFTVVAAACIIGACAGTGDKTASGKPVGNAGAPARYNLAGYPPAFRAGFNAACDAAKRHTTVIADRERYNADPQYRQGWKDGASICR